MSKVKKKKRRHAYYYPAGHRKQLRVGRRFLTLTDLRYYAPGDAAGKVFPKGSLVTFLGWREESAFDGSKDVWRFPKFQFDGDSHLKRVIEFADLDPVNTRRK